MPPRRPRPTSTVRLDAEGIAKVVGDLEARVLEVIWGGPRESSARAVHEAVKRDHNVALLTVVTVLNKLVAKHFLARKKVDGVFHYRATLTREAFLAQASRQIVEGILALGPDAMAASFIDVLAEQHPDTLAELSALVDRRRREQKAR